jgi:hypothetical protein
MKGTVMLNQDQHREPRAGRRLSRRSVLRGAATAGAAGLAVSGLAAAAGATASPALADAGRPAAPDQPAPELPARELPAGPIVVHVRDARSGDIEVFFGTSQTRLRDQELAVRIARAIG